MKEPVHFLDPNLLGYKKLYTFNDNWSLCRTWLEYKSGPERKAWTTDPTQVTCEDCKKMMRCSHDWSYLYTGRHGSDKGDDYFECQKCGWHLHESCTSWTPDRNDEVMEEILDKLKDDEAQLDLIHSGFKAYQWNV